MEAARRKTVGVALAVLAALFAWAAWNWFPFPREAGYGFAMSWGEAGSGPGQFDAPIGIAIHGDEIFISDSGNNRIQVFNREGEFLRSFGKEGDGAGELDRPMHMDFRDGKLYVAEYLKAWVWR